MAVAQGQISPARRPRSAWRGCSGCTSKRSKAASSATRSAGSALGTRLESSRHILAREDLVRWLCESLETRNVEWRARAPARDWRDRGGTKGLGDRGRCGKVKPQPRRAHGHSSRRRIDVVPMSLPVERSRPGDHINHHLSA